MDRALENTDDNVSEKICHAKNPDTCIRCSTLKILTKFESCVNKKIPSFIKNNILVINSGTVAVEALLHLLQLRFQEILKVHPIKIYCLYINDETSNKLNEHQLDHFFNEEIKQLGFENCMTSLSSFFITKKVKIECFDSTKQLNNTSEKHILNKFFNSLHDETAKKDLKLKLHEKMVINASKKLNCNLIMFADLATDFATNIVHKIVTGQCITDTLKNSLDNENLSSLKFLYPLRECYYEEITTYLKFYNQKDFATENRPVIHKNLNIMDITESFISKLTINSQFISATICKIFKKITPSNFKEFGKSKNFKKCSLCDKSVKFNHPCLNPSTEVLKWFSNYVSKKKLSDSSIKSLLDSHSSEQFKFIPIQAFQDLCIDEQQALYFKEANKTYICYACSLFL